MLLAATALSLYLANSALSADWLHFWHIHAGPAALGLHLSLKEWVNEGLMAIFFFVVGMDIKKAQSACPPSRRGGGAAARSRTCARL